MDTFLLFRGNRHISLRADDLTVNKISLIFQVRADSIFLTADDNRGVLPDEGGAFDTFELRGSSHYEVHGETTSDTSTPASTEAPVRFAFRRPQSASASTSSSSSLQAPRTCGVKMMQRSVFVAEVIDGALETQKTITVKFSEFDSSVASIKAKVVDALGQDEPVVLIDSHYNEIVDCDRTRGPAFWKQHARKIYAVPEGQLQRLRGSKRRRESRQEDSGLPSVLDQIEEVVLASQGLQDISKTLKDLVQFVQANQHTTLCLNEDQAAAVRAAFACIICKDPMKEPMFADCCRSLLGCQSCLHQWQESHTHCPKCCGEDFEFHIQSVVGLDDAVAALRNIIC